MNYKLESTQNASGNSACPGCGEISAYFGKCPACKRADAAVEAEREACAKLADRRAEYAVGLYQRRSAEAIASDIRARGRK